MEPDAVTTGAVAAPPDPLKSARDALNKLESDLDRAVKARNAYDSRSQQYADADADVKAKQTATRDARVELVARERELAPLLDAQRAAEQAATAGDVRKLLDASGAMFAYLKASAKTDDFEEAELAIDSMNNVLVEVKRVEADQAKALAASRKVQEDAMDRLRVEVRDAATKKRAVETEVARLNAAIRQSTVKLAEVEKSEGKDVLEALTQYERATKPVAPPAPPVTPDVKPKPAPKPVVRPGALRRALSTRDSVVEDVFVSAGL
jgi:hypothetical protein